MAQGLLYSFSFSILINCVGVALIIYSLSQFTPAHRLELQSYADAAGCFLQGLNNPLITNVP